jgi:hypothetical protein
MNSKTRVLSVYNQDFLTCRGAGACLRHLRRYSGQKTPVSRTRLIASVFASGMSQCRKPMSAPSGRREHSLSQRSTSSNPSPKRGLEFSLKGGDPAARSRTATLLRLHPNHQSQLGPGQAGTSVATGFRGVTGGVYKARERIHRSLLICDY